VGAGQHLWPLSTFFYARALNEHMEHPDGVAVFQHACKMGLEGIVSKRLGSRYRSGRSLRRDVHRGGHEQDAANQPNRGSREIRDAPNPVMSSHGLSSIASNGGVRSSDNDPGV
jgi:hypothetical protein